MKKVYLVENLDCGSCADKIERTVSGMDGVESANLNFLTQKLTVETSDERSETLLKDIQKAAKKVDRKTKVSVY